MGGSVSFPLFALLDELVVLGLEKIAEWAELVAERLLSDRVAKETGVE